MHQKMPRKTACHGEGKAFRKCGLLEPESDSRWSILFGVQCTRIRDSSWAHTHVSTPARSRQRTFPAPLRLTCTPVQSTDPSSSGADLCSDFCHRSFLLLSFLRIESFTAHCGLVTFAHHFVVEFRYLLSYSCVVGRSLWHSIIMESVKYITYQLREFCWNSHTRTV